MTSGVFTPAEAALLDRIRAQADARAGATGRCDRPAAETAVRAAYSAVALAPPDRVLWAGSPRAGLALALTLERRDNPLITRRFDEVEDESDFRDQVSRTGRWETVDWGHCGIEELAFWTIEEQMPGNDPIPTYDYLLFAVGAHLYSDWRWRSTFVDVAGAAEAEERPARFGERIDSSASRNRALGRGETRNERVRRLARDALSPWSWSVSRQALRTLIGAPPSPASQAVRSAIDHVGWWWPFREVAVLTERPEIMNWEQDPAGPQRLHREDGPALRWADGWQLWYWHGTRVPGDLVAPGWSARRILGERNVEIRRCAIERIGWPQLVEAARMRRVGRPIPDPGNPGRRLDLYRLPRRLRRDMGVNVLLCTNGSPERDGTVRRYGLLVPGHIDDPLEAAAWTYGLPAHQYADAERRT